MRAFLILLAACQCANALNPSLDIRQYAHKSWTIRDGFLKGSVWSIAQTPDGYLWLATTNGLLRFDGVRIVPWQPPAGERLPDIYVVSLLAARDGSLWIGTRRGLASWKDGKLTAYPELVGWGVIGLLEDRGGTVWASANQGMSGRLCEIHGGETRCYGEDGSLGAGPNALYEDSAGNLWVGALAYLWRWKPGPPKFYRMPDPELTIHALTAGDNGEMLIALRSGIRRLVNGKTEAVSLPGGARQVDPRAFLRDRNGGLWIGTDAGLLHVHQGKTDLFARQDGLSGDSAASLFEDREGNVWVATNDGGLDCFRDLAATTISVPQGLSNASVVTVLGAKDGSVWVGTIDGLNRWKDGQITVYRKRNSGLPDDDIEALFQDTGARIWVSTLHGNAYFENGRFVGVSGLPARYTRAVAEDADGSLWVSHDQGLFHLLAGKVAARIPWSSLGRKNSAFSLLADSVRRGLWLGFFEGGVAFFKDGQVRTFYGVSDGLGMGIVGGLQLDGDGTLWAATEGGLSRLRDGRVVTLTSGNGLPCDAVRCVMEDNDHSFWLSTSCGLTRIARSELEAWASDPKRTIRMKVFDSSDGVITSPVWGHVAKSTDGKLWFAALPGVSAIDPRHIPFNKLPPPVHIEQIIADRTTHEASSNLRLPALSRDLEIDYTALSLVAPEKNRFRVKLEGWDRDWKDAGNERKAFYGNLPPRNYRFRVVASNNDGVWNEAGAFFDFSIAPAYYQTRWFQAACGAAFLALLGGLYRYRLHQVSREFNMRLEERVGERTRLARDLHDTLLQGFQGLMLRLQAIDEGLPPGEVKDELERTLDRGDQVVAESRKAVHDLRLSTVVTNDLARAVRTMGDELSGEGSATFTLLVEGETRELHPIVRDEVYRVAREALRNAFTHARARHIEAEIVYGESLFRLRIRDDGEGIAPPILEAGRPGHYGLPGMRERAAEIGAKLDIWSGPGSGTEIDLSIAGSIAYGKRHNKL